MEQRYFDIYVINMGSGYSVPVAISTEKLSTEYVDDSVIAEAVEQDIFDADELPYVNNVREIDKEEYLQMMGQKVTYKTVITLTVLSEDNIVPSMDIEDIVNEIQNGDMSGSIELVSNEAMSEEEAIDALIEQGSDPDFFGLGGEEDEEEVIGFQIVNEEGEFIELLASFEVFENKDDAHKFIKDHNKQNKWKVVEIFEGEIENPSFL